MGADPRGGMIAELIRARVATLLGLVGDATDEQWGRVCPGEGWVVGLETYHIGLGLARQGGWIVDRISGGPPHDFSFEDTDRLNALVAQTESWRTKPKVLEFLKEQAERVIGLVLRLDHDEWEADAMTFGEKRRSAEFVMKVIAIRHIDDHTRNIRAGLESAT